MFQLKERSVRVSRYIRTLVRLAAATVVLGGALFAGAAPASAATTISINPGNVPTTASGFEEHSCDNIPGGASATKDGWVFVLPGNMGSFTSLTLTFKTTTGSTVVVHVPADGGAILNVNGTSKAWYQAPAGWTLIAATATITGSSRGFFVLTHTCPATGTPTPSPSGSTSSSPPTETPSSTPPSSSDSSSAAATLVSAATTAPGATVAVLGAGLIALWSVLFVKRRRQDAEES